MTFRDRLEGCFCNELWCPHAVHGSALVAQPVLGVGPGVSVRAYVAPEIRRGRAREDVLRVSVRERGKLVALFTRGSTGWQP